MHYQNVHEIVQSLLDQHNVHQMASLLDNEVQLKETVRTGRLTNNHILHGLFVMQPGLCLLLSSDNCYSDPALPRVNASSLRSPDSRCGCFES